MNKYSIDKVRLQNHLHDLRVCAGLSAEALARRIGVTKQAISLMETHLDKPITKAQYIALRTVFDEEINRNPDNLNLRDCYDLVFLDNDFYAKDKESILNIINRLVDDAKQAKSMKVAAFTGATTLALGGLAGSMLPLVFGPISIPITAGALSAGLGMGMVTKSIFKSDRDNKSGSKNKNRQSNDIRHPEWLREAIYSFESESNSKG